MTQPSTSLIVAGAQPPQALRQPVQRWPSLWGPRMVKLLAFALVLFLYRIWAVDHAGITLFFDEAQYWDWSRQLDWGYFSKPPMIAGLIWLSTTLFGSSVLGVKVLSMLLYPVSAVCMVGLARALWPTSSGVRTGVVAAALFMTIPAVGLLGLFASTDAPLILCWTLAAWALWRAQVTDRLPYWAALGVACGFGLMSKYTMAAFAVTALWTLWGVHGPRRGIARLGPWVAAIIALLLLSPNLIWNAQHGFPTLTHTADITTHADRAGGVMPTLEFLAGQILMLGPLAFVAGLWLYKRSLRPGAAVAAGASPNSQWAINSQMMSPSQWKNSTQAPPPVNKPLVQRSSARHLAAVSSYQYLWALSLPLIVIACAQSLNASAHVNWAAPSMVGLTLLVASRLSLPLIPLAAPRPTGWLVAVLLSNLVLTGVTVHLRELVGPEMPSKYDALARMRGWQEAFRDLGPEMEDPVVKGLPLLADSRLHITQAAYHWRDKNLQTLYWNPTGSRKNHYEMTRSLPNRVGPDVLLVSASRTPTDITQRFAITRHLKSTRIPVGPDRHVEMHLFFLRGFLGYDLQTYLEQSGTVHAPLD